MGRRRAWFGTALVVALACGDDLTAPIDTLLPINGFTTTLVDTGFNVGYAVALARDASGALHISHMGDGNGALKYATCATACSSPANWISTVVDTGLTGYAQYTWIGIDGGGRVHIGYSDASGGTAVVRYASCSSLCTTPANWGSTVVDTSANLYPTFVVAPDGPVHALWFGKQRDSVFYGTCTTSCLTLAAWSRAGVVAAPQPGSLAVTIDGVGALHATVSTVDSTFRYVVCGSSCLSGTRWRIVDLPWEGSAMVVGAGIAIDVMGSVHIAYRDWGRLSRYMHCVSSCAKSENWQVTLTDTTVGRVMSALVTTAAGRPRLSYFDSYVGGVLVGVCDSTPCDTVTKWQSMSIEIGNTGLFSSVVLDAWNRPIVAYHNNDYQDLRIAFPF